MPSNTPIRDKNFDLAAEAITVRIRWIGLCVGFVLANFIGRDTANQLLLNLILAVGTLYATVDTLWSFRRKVFLSAWPLAVSLMEAVYIGLLCWFDTGINSPFRFFYFLSLLVCAFRHSKAVTVTTFVLHALSYSALTLNENSHLVEPVTTFLVMLVLLGWVTWASTALAELVKTAGNRLSQLNTELQQNQALLEGRIEERTKELQKSQALLAQQEKQAAFGLLAAGIAHEVGNPLAAISSIVQMLNRRHYDDYTKERLEMVDEQLRRIQRTLRELVDFSRPANQEVSHCDVHEILDAALNIAKYYKRKKGKRIVTRYAVGIPSLRTVRDQLVQVFLNLVLNALDATAEGGAIVIATSIENGWLRIDISDDGHGIAPEDRDRLFLPYFTTKSSGTGLGLFVCKHVVEKLDQGSIELTTSSPEGTTFTVRLTCDNIRNHHDIPPPDDLPERAEELQATS